MPINRNNYPNLYGPPPSKHYAIVAQTGITSAVNVNINNGAYYGSAASGATGTYTGGVLDNSVAAATSDISLLTTAITSDTGTPFPAASSGIVSLSPGVYDISILPINVTLVFNSGPNPLAQYIFRGSSTLIFNGISMVLNGARSDKIYWYAPAEITFTGTSNIYGTFVAGTNIAVSTSASIYGNLFAGSQVTFAQNTTITDFPTVCYLKGTKILTQDGYTPIEQLNVGDKVFTNGTIDKYNEIDLDNEFFLSPITWIGHFKVYNKTPLSLPICFQPHSLSTNCPSETLYVSPLHRIFIQGKMVEAKELVNHSTIFQDTTCATIEYYHFELKTHSCVVANGVLSETYFDSNTKFVFQPSEALPTLISA
jgi:hypothetical protein